MRIVLVNPQRVEFMAQTTGYHDRYSSTEPLGICYLAASLREAGFPDVKIIDRGTHGFTDAQLRKAILDEQPDLLGFSTNGMDITCAFSLSEQIKQLLPNVHITLGGRHVTFIPEQILGSQTSIDSVVVGDGDDTLCELAQALR